MPRDAKCVKPFKVEAWVTVFNDGSYFVDRIQDGRRSLSQWDKADGLRTCRVLITELPPKRKRHAP